jgi:PPOX class probable FMN-dependent enzyme
VTIVVSAKTENSGPKTDITSVEQLRAIYGEPRLTAANKVVHRIDEHIAAFIAKSPFMLMATVSVEGRMDVSPKGDLPGFVQVRDEQTLLYPDRPGNNRIDGLQNIVETGRIGLIFLVPGVRETLRINGSARISVEPELLARFAVNGKLPRSVTVIEVDEAFFHCARALIRSGLWDPARHIDRSELPSMGTILAAHTGGLVDQCEYDAELPRRIVTDLY